MREEMKEIDLSDHLTLAINLKSEKYKIIMKYKKVLCTFYTNLKSILTLFFVF
jgi:hypothetical protein